MNDDNTLTNPNYYSNSAFKNGAEEKKGLNFTGAYYKKNSCKEKGKMRKYKAFSFFHAIIKEKGG